MATARWALIVLVVIGAAIALGLGLVAVSPLPQRPTFPLALRWLGVILVAGGVALGAWTFAHHPPRLMAQVTASTIQATMQKRAPSTAVPRLLTSGPYAVVRNPTYLAVLLSILGLALAIPATGLFVSAAILLLWWNVVVIPPEEKELAARFGEEYGAYRARTWRFVPRW